MANKKDSMRKYLMVITEKKKLSSNNDYEEAKKEALKAISKNEAEVSYFDYNSEDEFDKRYNDIKKAAKKLGIKIRNKNADNKVEVVGKIFVSDEANAMYNDFKEYEQLSREIEKIKAELKNKTDKINKLEEKLKPVLESINAVYKKNNTTIDIN